MKATELIKDLQHFVEIYGDLDMRVDGDCREKEIRYQVFSAKYLIIANSSAPL